MFILRSLGLCRCMTAISFDPSAMKEKTDASWDLWSKDAETRYFVRIEQWKVQSWVALLTLLVEECCLQTLSGQEADARICYRMDPADPVDVASSFFFKQRLSCLHTTIPSLMCSKA